MDEPEATVQTTHASYCCSLRKNPTNATSSTEAHPTVDPKATLPCQKFFARTNAALKLTNALSPKIMNDAV